MDTFLKLVKVLSDNYQIIVTNLVAVLGGLYALSMLVPGEHPQKEIKAALDFTEKYSAKKKDLPPPPPVSP